MKPTEISIYNETLEWIKKSTFSYFAQESIASTNDKAKSEALTVTSDEKIYFADIQSHGRGRGENAWLNASPGSSFLVTYSFRVAAAPQAITSPLMGLALFQALIETFPNLALSIKAPNDIYLNEKKVAGLLIETVQMGDARRLLIGLGLNVLEAPKQIENSTYLASLTAINSEKWFIFLELLRKRLLDASYKCLQPQLSTQECHALLTALNKNPNLNTKFTSVTPEGNLVSSSGILNWRDL